jgi:signal transduction histidine kinase
VARRTEATRRERNVNGAEPGAQTWPSLRSALGLDTLARMPTTRHGDGSAGWSLEHRLPVLIFVLLACVVGGLSLAAYREVRATAVVRATDRLERVGRELLSGAANTTLARADSLRAVGSEPLATRAMACAATQAEVEARLTAAHPRGDSTLLGWQLATLRGGPRYASTSGWSAADSVALAATIDSVARSAADRRSPFYAVGGRMHNWLVVPVVADGEVVGTLAELRRVGDNKAGEAAIIGLIDDGAGILLTSRGSTEWLSLRGRPVSAPFALPAVEGYTVRAEGPNGAAYAVRYTVPTTPWTLVLFQSEASVLRRPYEFLRRMLGAGSLVLALAILGAWLLSRHVTRPLRDVTNAAVGLAEGDYARRVRVSGGGREMASLSTTFNAMAAAIADAHVTLADRNEALFAANAAKAQFLAMMSHELRTPLNAIGGFTELLELGLRGPVTPEQVEDLGRIRRNKDLLLSIITDILEFARTDAGALSVKSEPVSVADLLIDLTDLVGPQMQAKGIRFIVGPVPADAIARADRERAQQVLLNLLSNATKFTDSGGEIAIETTTGPGDVRIAVRDTGPGISPGQLESIFEPFVQVDSSLTRRAGGTGLGLAIARKLTAAMGGSLVVESAPGSGSTFTLRLPHADASGQQAIGSLTEERDERQPA